MATTTKLVQSLPKFKPPKPTSTHFYSSSSNDPPTPPPPPRPSEPHRNNEASKPFSFSSSSNNTPPSKSTFDEILKNLAEFRRRSSDSLSPPPPPPRFPTPSFQELYHQRNANSERPNVSRPTGRIDFNAIRQGLKNSIINNNQNNENRGKTSDSLSLSSLKNSLKLRPDADHQGGMVIGGGGRDKLPKSIFGKEMNRDKERDKEVNRTKFVKLYGKDELGRKLRELRPAGLKKKEFSLQELSERLVKLRENDENESTKSSPFYQDLRDSLFTLQASDVEKPKKTMIERLDILGRLGGTPSFMLHPPKEHLIEKYFHPDNMSSEEKMKLELQKVRDEFKMSESDCGSARVQVAQLTTKIKHLSTVLHKKDKHSRKGLQAMVQKRKKLLKYLRRTDWDSFCLVLSKLGLRDNPDYKF